MKPIISLFGMDESLVVMEKNTEKVLEETIDQLKEREKHINHLNLVLQAIRNVNQLITFEKDKEKLLQGVCDCLTETRGFGTN